MTKILKKSFFQKPTLGVARNLLGKILIRKFRRKLIKGIITETEAYCGPEDKASHASHGRTERTKVMFGEAGTIYVYLIYGMHYCLNIVTEEKNYPAAVLIRGVRINLPDGKAGNQELSGPGKVSKYFHIDKSLNAKKLGKKTGLWVEQDSNVLRSKIQASRRIGVDYAGKWAEKPWRFFVVKYIL
ncbi:MAG: DNA-3-methyladenine glycosylase [bacterium]|nr:DNA-3-methyladenine glycosylase [bacterium]